MAFAKGTSVRQIMPAPVEGVVTGFMMDNETGEVLHCVEWTDGEGETHSRFFKQVELTAQE